MFYPQMFAILDQIYFYFYFYFMRVVLGFGQLIIFLFPIKKSIYLFFYHLIILYVVLNVKFTSEI